MSLSSVASKPTHAPQQLASSFDHLVGPNEQCRRDVKTERLGSLEVDDEFELGGELNWQMGDGGAFEYFVYICCGAMKAIPKINSIANEPKWTGSRGRGIGTGYC